MQDFRFRIRLAIATERFEDYSSDASRIVDLRSRILTNGLRVRLFF